LPSAARSLDVADDHGALVEAAVDELLGRLALLLVAVGMAEAPLEERLDDCSSERICVGHERIH
jgi:hypothetical protein